MNFYLSLSAPVAVIAVATIMLIFALGGALDHQWDGLRGSCLAAGGHVYQPYDAAMLYLTEDGRVMEVR